MPIFCAVVLLTTKSSLWQVYLIGQAFQIKTTHFDYTERKKDIRSKIAKDSSRRSMFFAAKCSTKNHSVSLSVCISEAQIWSVCLSLRDCQLQNLGGRGKQPVSHTQNYLCLSLSLSLYLSTLYICIYPKNLQLMDSLPLFVSEYQVHLKPKAP